MLNIIGDDDKKPKKPIKIVDISELNIQLYDLNRCAECNNPILPDEEICESLNDNGGVYKVRHFNCAFPTEPRVHENADETSETVSRG
jgi:hypothetical protein